MRNNLSVSKEHLLSAPLPQATATYTVISHGFVIDNVKRILAEKGFNVIKEKYTSDLSANVATGSYYINYEGDSEMGMLFAFSNSYDKTVRFKCAIGGFVKANEAAVLNDTGSAWGRMHTGTADKDALQTIEQQINNAQGYFKQLKADKEVMKKIELTTTQFAELVGRLYIDLNIITGVQLRIIKKQFTKSSFNYSSNPDSLWTLYNHILVSLERCHPRSWMEQQKIIHLFIMTEYQLTMFDDELVAVKDPNQLDLVEEAEKLLGMHDNPEIPSQEEINAGTYAEEMEPEELTAADMEEEEPKVNGGQFTGLPPMQDEMQGISPEAFEEAKQKLLPKGPRVIINKIAAPVDLDAEEDDDWEKAGMVPIKTTAVISEGDEGYGATNAEEEVQPEPEPIAEKPADEPAEKPKPTIKMVDAIALYGHLVSDEERGLLLKGKAKPESIQILKDAYMADQAKEEAMVSQEVQSETKPEAIMQKIVEEKVETIVNEEYVKSATDGKTQLPFTEERFKEIDSAINAGAILPPMPGQAKKEEPKVEEVVEEVVENVVIDEVSDDAEDLDGSEFFMTKQDLDTMYPGTTLELGFVVTVMDQDFEITTCDPKGTEYGLTALTDDFEEFDNSTLAESTPTILGADSPEEEAEVMEVLAEAGLAKPTSMKEVAMEEQQVAEKSMAELDPEPQEMSGDFEIGDAEVGVPAESMLATSVKEDLVPIATAEETAIKDAIDSEIEDLYGAKIPFTYKLNGNQYNVKLETGETVVLTEAYIKKLQGA